LARANKQDLARLVAACNPAPFDQGAGSAVDESLRKAHKLKLSQFASPFDLASTNILGKISQELMHASKMLARIVRAEPYELSIYGNLLFTNSVEVLIN
jgi:type III secretory pathway component EscU